MRKLIIMLMVALLPMSLLTNSSFAENTPNATKKLEPNTKANAIKIWHRIQAMKQQTEIEPKMKARSRSTQPSAMVSTSAEYQGKASDTKQDEYVFYVASPSKVQITSKIASTKLDYLLVGKDDLGSEAFYVDGDTLPAGQYSFIAFAPNSAPLIDYDYVISGITFAKEPDTTLPKLTFTTPSFPISRLAQNTSSIQFTGTTDTQTFVNNQESFDQDYVGDFDFSVPLHPGNNFVDFQTMTESGNSIHINLTLTVPAYKRIDGADRYIVAASVAKDMPPSDTVVIASGLNDKFADALAGSSVAGLYQAPILMTTQTTLPAATIEEIQRRQPTQAIIMGGDDTVNPVIETQLMTLGIQTVKRIDGANRYAVSVNAAKELKRVLGPDQMRDGALVASGMVFPDALSASPIASDSQIPILLVSSKGLPTEVATYLQSESKITQVTTVGGSVPKAAIDKLQSLGRQITKIDGADRYAVNFNVTKVFGVDLNYLVFAVGTKFPDALSGGPFASSLSSNLSPLFLTPTAQLPANLQTYLNDNKADIQVIYILGGTDSVSEAVATKLNQFVQ